MINKEILNLNIPFIPGTNRAVVTQTLEWSLSLTIFSYVFGNHGLQHHIISSPSNGAAGYDYDPSKGKP